MSTQSSQTTSLTLWQRISLEILWILCRGFAIMPHFVRHHIFGTICCFILRDVLRNEWGYKGMVVSDWSSVTEMIAHGFCTDRKDAAEKSANAGVDMEMVSRSFIDNLEQLVKEGKVKEYIEAMISQHGDFASNVSQVLIPTEKIVTVRNGKRVIKERNKLPGYVLVECNLTDECYPLLRNIPNVLGFLLEGNKPAIVPQTDINKMIGTVDETMVESMMDEVYLVGERVKVISGAFNGFEGVIDEVAQDKRKLKVVVTIFDRQTPLELGFDQVEKE